MLVGEKHRLPEVIAEYCPGSVSAGSHDEADTPADLILSEGFTLGSNGVWLYIESNEITFWIIKNIHWFDEVIFRLRLIWLTTDKQTVGVPVDIKHFRNMFFAFKHYFLVFLPFYWLLQIGGIDS